MSTKLKILVMTVSIIVASCCFITLLVENSMYNNTLAVREEARKEEERKKEEAQKEEEDKKQLIAEYEKKTNDYEIVNEYYNQLALVMKDNKWGYIDYYGVEVIPLQYDVANNFSNKYAKVKKDGKWGYIDTEGKEIVPIEYYYCSEPSNGMVAVGNGGQYGFVSIKTGEKICELIYDKVEPFNDKNMAKVIRDKKYGYIDDTGKEIVALENTYIEENKDFTGEWKGTETHSSKAGTVTITGQLATSFDFKIDAKYFSKTGTIEGTADIISANTAEYKYGKGDRADVLTFKIIDDMLNITAKNGGNCGMDKEVSAVGKYTADVPEYTNSGVMKRVFDEDKKLLKRIENALGEEYYEDYFLYGFKYGEYSEKELDEDTDILKGDLYTVKVPTMERDFKLLITKDNVYFFAKHKEVYKTDDENRLTRIPSAIAFDEL